MPIDVTPERSREPEDFDTRSENQGVPVADPPEAPPPAEDESQIEIEEPKEDLPEPDEEDDEDDVSRGIVSVARVAAVSTVVAFVAVALAASSIVGLKAARRRKRRNHPVPSVQIAGAWAELVDRADEAGAVLPAQATPSEAARLSRSIDVLAAPALAAGVERLADQVSAAAFHPVPPSASTAAEAWRTYEEIEAALAAAADRRTRFKRAIDPRPLRDDALVDVR